MKLLLHFLVQLKTSLTLNLFKLILLTELYVNYLKTELSYKNGNMD